ncbi:MAG: hypothetical protein Greene041619_994 [Candidatus Peregrinibacteria bacterium Greene0416_19]|nr:MAG: hypothetical protein Greene041619_994 [Candidatus Peregrinibacteria bacterium Greene0416_19]
MPLKSITFPELFSRNTAALERAGYRPAMDLEALSARNRHRISTLLAARAHIEDLASTDDQREAYGRQRWEREFVRLGTIDRDQHLRSEGESLRWYLWNRMQSCRFKRFQELFCLPANFIVPRFTTDERGNVDFDGKPQVQSLSLKPCLVNPDLIPEKLLMDLGLCDFEEENGNTVRRLEQKRDVIPRLKQLWEAAVPLQKGHHRLLAIREPSAEVRARYPGIEGPPSSSLGTILYMREDESGRNGAAKPAWKPREPRPPRSFQAQHFSSVYAAHRKTFHESRVYEREIDQLTDMKEHLASMNGTLDAEWRTTTTASHKASLRARAQELLQRCRDLLSACENRYKVQACDLLAAVSNLTDSSGRENISVTMSKMVGAINRLMQRFEEMFPKGGYNQQDQMVLQRQIREHETVLKMFRRGVTERGDDPSSPLRPEELDRIRLAPFLVYAGRLREKCETYNDALGNGNRDMVIDTLIQMHVIGKFQAVRTCFEHVKQFTLDPAHIPVQRIRDFVRTLRELFSARQIFPDRVVEAYQAPFDRLERSLQILDDGLSRCAEQDRDISRRSALYRHLKEYLAAYDIEAIVRALP